MTRSTIPGTSEDRALNEAFEAGYRAGMETAASMIDCGCVQRAEVVKCPTNSARRWELCGQPNCTAIEAAAIRAAAKEITP